MRLVLIGSSTGGSIMRLVLAGSDWFQHRCAHNEAH